jgi:hypothetical protein
MVVNFQFLIKKKTGQGCPGLWNYLITIISPNLPFSP